MLVGVPTWHSTRVKACWQRRLLVNTLPLESVCGGGLYQGKTIHGLLMRHVALLNLITQGKDNLNEKVDVSEMFRDEREE